MLDINRHPYVSALPVACMDEALRQLIGETRVQIPVALGRAPPRLRVSGAWEPATY